MNGKRHDEFLEQIRELQKELRSNPNFNVDEALFKLICRLSARLDNLEKVKASTENRLKNLESSVSSLGQRTAGLQVYGKT